MITLLVAPEELQKEEIQVGGEGYRHLFRARRVAVGEAVRLVDGVGHARFGSVFAVDRSAGRIAVGEPAAPNEPPLHLELFCAFPKPERAAWLVEKATEIGASAVRFLRSERAPRDPGSGALARLQRVAASAVEQSHRARLPEISGVHEWSDLRGLSDRCHARFVLEPSGNSGAPALDAGVACLLVGPEGGFTAAELAELDALAFARLRLGARILRTETAAVAGAALLLQGKD